MYVGGKIDQNLAVVIGKGEEQLRKFHEESMRARAATQVPESAADSLQQPEQRLLNSQAQFSIDDEEDE